MTVLSLPIARELRWEDLPERAQQVFIAAGFRPPVDASGLTVEELRPSDLSPAEARGFARAGLRAPGGAQAA